MIRPHPPTVSLAKTFGQHWAGAFIAYIVMDLLLAGLGLGTPVFCIVFGFGVGWFSARRAEFFVPNIKGAMKRALRYAFLTSAVTMVLMAIIWARLVPILLNPRVNPGSLGLPLNLYDTRWSLAGWLLLMVFTGPAIQVLMTAFGSYLTFLVRVGARAGFGS
ncbi:MAG: hypothetical protein ABIK37_06945 [candidate division WOR-3 bacterium]